MLSSGKCMLLCFGTISLVLLLSIAPTITASSVTLEDGDELNKRGWQDVSSSWGKRGWKDMQGTWGKRAWDKLNGAWGKRFVQIPEPEESEWARNYYSNNGYRHGGDGASGVTNLKSPWSNRIGGGRGRYENGAEALADFN